MFKPMLATRETPEEVLAVLRFPCYASAKLDGIRCITKGGKALTRSLKPIPNDYVREYIESRPELHDLDMELITGEPTHPNACDRARSAFMSKKGEPSFTLFVFDELSMPHEPFHIRQHHLQHRIFSKEVWQHLVIVDQYPMAGVQEVLKFEEEVLERGYEGLILRCHKAAYKNNRSTLKEQGMMKLKRFVDDEAEIIGFEEFMHNENEAFTNELGNTKRSTNKENLRGGDMLGAFVCRDKSGVVFNIGGGPGLTQALRKQYWQEREQLIGKLAKFKHFPIGRKDAPRHPKFLGFRAAEDTGE